MRKGKGGRRGGREEGKGREERRRGGRGGGRGREREGREREGGRE